MPYIKEESVIYTKVLNVTTANNEDSRQAVLMAISEEPESVKVIYTTGTQVYVLLHNGKNYLLGEIRQKYAEIIDKHATRVKSWKITGGYHLNDPEYKNLKANYGLNLTILILD